MMKDKFSVDVNEPVLLIVLCDSYILGLITV